MIDKSNQVIIVESQQLHKIIESAIVSTLNGNKELKNPDSPKNDLQLLSTEQLAKTLQVSTQTVDRWRKKNRIPFIKIGKSYRYEYNLVIQQLSNKKGGKI